MRKWLSLKSGLTLAALLVIIAVGITYAVEVQRGVSGSVIVGRVETVGETLLLYTEAPPSTADLTELDFGTADVNVFGLFKPAPRIPVWIKNGGDIAFKLRVEAADIKVNGTPTGGVLGGELLPSPQHTTVIGSGDVVAFEVGLRFLGTPEELGIGTGDRISFTALFIAQGPITAIPTPMPTPTPTDPRRGGTLRLAEGWSWRGAMDFISSGVFQAVMLNQTGNLLIQYNPESDDPLELVGDLATGWEVGADGKSYTFTLNPKAKWHDGVPVTAADIKWTLDTGAFPEMDEPRWFWAFYADSYKSSTVIDAKTVRVDLKFPSPAFMLYLASVYMQMQPKHHFDGKPLAFREELDNALGSGPFILTDLDPGVSHFYERNPDYWKPGRPYLDGLKYFTIVGGDATIAAYKAGQLQMSRDAAGALSNAEALELAKDEVGRLTVHWGGPMSQIALWLNLDKPPFDNVKVRQAINLVIHRPQFIETLTLGQATLGYPFPPDFWFSPTEAEVTQVPGFRSLNGEKHPDDIAEAQRLMAEAGFADGFETNFLARNLFGTPEMAQVAADQLRRTLNITGTVDVVDLNVEQTRRTAGDWEILPQSVATNMLDTLVKTRFEEVPAI